MNSNASLSDEQLVVLVRDKDQEKYALLVKRYQNKLLRYAKNLLNNDEEAIDIVQEAFIKAFKNLKSFNPKKKFSSWIYRIVHNLSIDYIRKHKKQISLEEHSWLSNFLKSREDIELDFDKKELEGNIERILKDLPVNYRSVLSLYYLEDKSYDEIGEILKVSTGTVGTWLSRAKKEFKNKIDKYE